MGELIAQDISETLAENSEALRAFERLPLSHRREYLRWIGEAKKPETRKVRIENMISRLLAASVG